MFDTSSRDNIIRAFRQTTLFVEITSFFSSELEFVKDRVIFRDFLSIICLKSYGP